MMKVLLLVFWAFVLANAKQCNPKYHFWRPYNGTIPRDAFVAATDEDGRRSFIAKIIPMDQYSWTVPAQFKEGCDHVNFNWCCGSEKVMVVDEFIEILCSETPENLSWRNVNNFATEISSDCCMVQGGIGWFSNRIYRAFIGKGMKEDVNLIGRIYLEHEWPGLHTMDGSTSTKVFTNFSALTYDCKQENPKLE